MADGGKIVHEGQQGLENSQELKWEPFVSCLCRVFCVLLPTARSTKMRIDYSHLDYFLSFLTNPHVIQDLPFGQRYLYLSGGKILESPNVIPSMVNQRVIDQYQQHCLETNFKPFIASTMQRILVSCSATVRKSLRGLDYLSAELKHWKTWRALLNLWPLMELIIQQQND